jgi:hypothetical protein
MIKEPEEYLQLISTGTYQPMIQSTLTHLDLIRRENEALSLGPPIGQNAEGMQTVPSVPVMPTDNHELHMQEHKCPLDAPNARTNQAIIGAVLAHISEHRGYVIQAEAAAAMSGQPPAEAAPPGQSAPDGGREGKLSAGAVPSEPSSPAMPQNPMTGERAESAA